MTTGSFIDEERLPYPFCPGCSHGVILDMLNSAMISLELEKENVVIVTDIGCVGLSDQWFNTHTFHGLHGRSVLYGQGLKLANPNLNIIVFMGDGGAGIGGHHLINAARRNIGITVILFNNFNFGMTGGEHSVTTPEGSISSSSLSGSMGRPIKHCETMVCNGAAFVARRTIYDKDLEDLLKQAVSFNGFSFLEVFEFCTAYFVPMNSFRKKEMESLINKMDTPRLLHIDKEAIEYTDELIENSKHVKYEDNPPEEKEGKKYKSRLEKLDIVIAGSAGQKIRASSGLLARSGLTSGLFVVQRDNYPVTIKSGYSVSYIKLSTGKISFFGIRKPDIIIIMSKDGLDKTAHYLGKMNRQGKVFISAELDDIVSSSEIIKFDLNNSGIKIHRDFRTIAVIIAILKREKILDIDAYIDAAGEYFKNQDYETFLEIADNVDVNIFDS